MPETKVFFYQEDNSVPMADWLEEVARRDRKVLRKLFGLIQMLKTYGHELHRPYADFLRDGIYELRIPFRHVQYRILYFFHGRNVVILTHGLMKEGQVPDWEINRAIERKEKFEADPAEHTYDEEGV